MSEYNYQVNPLGLEANEYQVAIKKKGAKNLNNTIDKIDNIFDKMTEKQQEEFFNAIGKNVDEAIDSYKEKNPKLAKRLEDYKEYCDKYNVDSDKKNNIWANLISTLQKMNKKEEMYKEVQNNNSEQPEQLKTYIENCKKNLEALYEELDKPETTKERETEIKNQIQMYRKALMEKGAEIPNEGKLNSYAIEITSITDKGDIKDHIKNELKTKGFYTDEVKDYMNSDEFNDLAQKVADRNAMNLQITKGYVGVKKSSVKHFQGMNTANATNKAAGSSGAEIAMNKGNEDVAAAEATNMVSNFDRVIEDITIEKAFIQDAFPVETLDEDENVIDTRIVDDGFTTEELTKKDGSKYTRWLYKGEDISQITLADGTTIQGYDNYKNIKLNQIKDIETTSNKGNSINTTHFTYDVVSPKDMRRLYRGNGGRVIDEKKNEMMKNAAIGLASAIGGTLTGLLFTHTTNVVNTFSHTIKGDASWTSDLLEQIQKELNEGLKDKNVQVALEEFDGGFTYKKIQHIRNKHNCSEATLLTALTAIAGDVLQAATANTQEKAVDADKYLGLAKMFTDAKIKNATGAEGYIMNKHEYNCLIAENKALIYDLIEIAPDVVKAVKKGKETEAPVVETQEVENEKVARIEIETVPVQACSPYIPISGEHWTSITGLGFIDKDGNAISGDDLVEVARILRQRNGYSANEAKMPPQVIINPENPDDPTITTKNGNTYTWKYCNEEPTPKARKAAIYTYSQKDEDGKMVEPPADVDTRRGKSRVTQAKIYNITGIVYDTKGTEKDETDDIKFDQAERKGVQENNVTATENELIKSIEEKWSTIKKWLNPKHK